MRIRPNKKFVLWTLEKTILMLSIATLQHRLFHRAITLKSIAKMAALSELIHRMSDWRKK